MEWLEPWWPTAEMGRDFEMTFEEQLRIETGPEHPLSGIPVRTLGRRNDNDDVLFEVLDGSGRMAVVHLTWAKSQEQMPWPATTLYESMETWCRKRMQSDNAKYIAEEE